MPDVWMKLKGWSSIIGLRGWSRGAMVMAITAIALAACQSPKSTQASSPDRAADKADLVKHTVPADGHPLAVWEKSPENPVGTVVLVHGRTWSSVPDFDLQVPGEDLSLMDGLVAEGYATYAVDLRGYGETPRDNSGWATPDRSVADVAAVLEWVADRVGHKPALFGWSNGAAVSHLTAQRHGDLMSMVALFGYGHRVRSGEVMEYPDVPPAIPTTAEAAASDFIVPGSISQPAIDEYVRHALEADPVRVDWKDFHQWAALDPSEIHTPTLLMQGEHDPLAPTETQAAFMTALGTADRQWVTIAGGDHAAFLETPRAAFIHALASFLNRPR